MIYILLLKNKVVKGHGREACRLFTGMSFIWIYTMTKTCSNRSISIRKKKFYLFFTSTYHSNNDPKSLKDEFTIVIQLFFMVLNRACNPSTPRRYERRIKPGVFPLLLAVILLKFSEMTIPKLFRKIVFFMRLQN